VKCRKAGVLTPTIFDVDIPNLCIIFEFISGTTLKEFISQTDDRGQLLEMARLVGNAIGRVHAADIVHGDLTSSNLMVSFSSVPDDQTPRVHLIDFGLGMTRPAIEDKAVDLYVLERALISTHPGSEYLVSHSLLLLSLTASLSLQTEAVLQSYREAWGKSEAVLQRLEQVRQRGRKRDMIG
jgi:TP53 regulating kinase and related kinases